MSAPTPGVAVTPLDQLIAVGDSVTKNFQLVKTYGGVFAPYRHPIAKPIAVLPSSVLLWRDVWHRAFILNLTTDRIAVAFVRLQDRRSRHLLQKKGARRAIGDLSAGVKERDRTTIGVGQGMDFCGASAT